MFPNLNKTNLNYKLYFIYALAKKSLLWFFVTVIYYQANGLTFTRIATIAAIGSFSSFIVEIPTGVISDFWSRKASLQISELMKLASLIIVIVSPKFFFLCLSSFIWGIADSCQSGSAESLSYELFEENNELELYGNYLSKIYSYGFVVTALSTFFASTLFSVNIVLPVIISIVSVIVAFISISLLRYSPNKNKEREVNVIKFNKLVISSIFKSKILLLLLITSSFVTISIATINTYTQSLLLDKNLNLSFLGSAMFIYNLCMAFGSRVSGKLPKWLDENIILLFFGLLSIIAGAGTSYIITFAAIVIIRFLNGALWPILMPKVNMAIDTSIRATVLSYQNMLVSILFIVLEPLVGISIDLLGLRSFYVLFGGLLIVISSILIFISRKLNQKMVSCKINCPK
jgi:MFS family permease